MVDAVRSDGELPRLTQLAVAILLTCVRSFTAAAAAAAEPALSLLWVLSKTADARSRASRREGGREEASVRPTVVRG